MMTLCWKPGPLIALAASMVGTTAALASETVADAWRMALDTDAGFAAVRSERQAADADASAAQRGRLPVLEVTGSYNQLQDAPFLEIPTASGVFRSPKIWKHDAYAMASADLAVPMWTSGRLSGGIGAAQAGARGAAAQEQRAASDLKLAVAESYVSVLRARRGLAMAESVGASLRAHTENVQVMYDRETVPQADLLAARVAFANAEQQRLRAANGVRLATAAYNRLVGQPLERVPELADPSPAPSVTSGEPLDRQIATALQRRPEISTLASAQESLEQSAKAERANALPQLVLHAGYSHVDNQILDRENFASVGVGIQWRLFDSGQTSARMAALRSRARAFGQQRQDLESRIRLEVEAASLNREEALSRISAARSAVEQAQENLRVARELYGSGLGTNTQVLDAETLRTTALTNRDDAEFDLVLANYRLQRAIGEL